MIVELLTVTALLVGGAALLRTTGLRGWALAPLGFLAGIGAYSAVGLAQVTLGLPTWPAVTLAVTVAVPVAWWSRRWWRGDQVRISPVGAGLAVAAVAAVVWAVREVHLVKWHTDSLTYLMAGSLLADNTYTDHASTHLLTKRLLGVPLLHAPAHLGGEWYLRSVTPLLALATVAALIWIFRHGVRGARSPRHAAWFAALGALLLVTNNRFVFSAFYLNGHLLVAALLILIAGCGWLLAREEPVAPPRALRALQLLAIPALVIARPETSVLAGLALLPTWLSGRIPVGHRALTMVVLAVANTLWQGYSVWLHVDRGAEVPLTTTGTLGLGVPLLLALPLLWWRRLPRVGRYLLWTAEAGLWLALLLLAARRPALLRASLAATAENLLGGEGKWGRSLVVLAGLVLVGIVFTTSRGREFLRFPVTTFVPFALVLAYLRDEPYRVGYGDSLSRMFMHVVPLAVLFVMVSLASGRPRSPIPTADNWSARRPVAASPVGDRWTTTAEGGAVWSSYQSGRP